MLSTSGRSSRSTLMLTNSSFITAATAGSSNDSCAITWHQWHAEYPTLSSTGLSSAFALANASSPHGYQLTGLSWCCRKYGLVSDASRFMMSRSIALPVFADLPPYSGGRSAKSASDPGRNRLGAVDHLVVVKVLDIPAKRLEHDPALRVTEHLASGAVPLASLRLQVDPAVGVRQVEFGDRYAFHFDD